MKTIKKSRESESLLKIEPWSENCIRRPTLILSAEQLAEATGGTLHQVAKSGSITTDTRQIKGQEWFIPLIGARFDAHDFLEKASDLGCLGTIASRVPSGWQKGWIEVPDTLEALQNIARYIRNRFDGTVVGITGSAGKTTLRVMIQRS